MGRANGSVAYSKANPVATGDPAFAAAAATVTGLHA
jgi:hypothetical protein